MPLIVRNILKPLQVGKESIGCWKIHYMNRNILFDEEKILTPELLQNIKKRAIKRLYILGAGASASLPYKLPLAKELFPLIRQMLNLSQKTTLNNILYEVGIPPRKKNINFEDFLSILFSRSLNELFQNKKQYNINQDRGKIVELLLLKLEQLLLQGCKKVKNNKGPYDRLVASLGPNDAIISFNWDILLELACLRAGKKFCYLPDDDNVNNILIIKPHGSINWFPMLERELLFLDLKTNWALMGHSFEYYYMLYLKNPLGSKSFGKSSYSVQQFQSKYPAIVAPHVLKQIIIGGTPVDEFVDMGHKRFISSIWFIFQKLVEQVSELFIIGYSLPGIDSESIETLKCFSKNSKSKKINTIIRDQQINDRIKRILRIKPHNICKDFVKF